MAYYPFISASLDRSTNSNNGVAINATLSSDRFGKPGQAFAFGESSSHIQIPWNQTMDNRDFTISAWAKGSGTVITRLIDGNNDSSNHDAFVFTHRPDNNEERIWHMWDPLIGPRKHTYNGTMDSDAWHMLTAVKDGTNLTFYLDGSQAAAFTSSVDNNPYVNEANWYIGNQIDNGSFISPFVGEIDDVRIYARPLSASEVSTLYNLSP